MFKRSSGLLAHVTMLPGPYGCGTFGRASEKFVDMLAEAGFTWWQVLPLSHPELENSPYTAYSAFALNPLLADPGLMLEDGLITAEEEQAARWYGSEYAVDFDAVGPMRARALEAAFSRLSPEALAAVRRFAEAESYWLPDYARYMAELDADGGEPSDDRVLYHEFVQWVLDSQWQRLKKYANGLGVRIMGDMPIYVSANSSDFRAHPEFFMLDPDGRPSFIAGVPPDFFSEDGQLWRNPLYNWDAMERDGYGWWLRRISKALRDYDGVRIDHFRGFSAFWAVPAGAETARGGKWVKGPGMKLFGLVKEKYPDADILAEDLGDLDQDVYDLIAATGYPGMRILQFAFGEGAEDNLPHNYPRNCATYTGTHDNNTLLGWFYETEGAERDLACRYIGIPYDGWREGGPYSPVCRAAARCLWQSQAVLAIVPYQDLLGWGADTRFNRPGVPSGNWAVRITWESLYQIDRQWWRQLSLDFGRLEKPKKQNENETIQE